MQITEFIKIVNNAIEKKQSIDSVFRSIIEPAIKKVSADAGSFLIVDEYEDVLKVKAVSGFFPPLYEVPDSVKSNMNELVNHFNSTSIRLGETILGKTAKSGEPVFIKNTSDEPLLLQNTQNDLLFVSSVIIIPIVISKRILGILAVIIKKKGKVFMNDDYEYLKTIGKLTAFIIDYLLSYMIILEKQKIEKEIAIAADIKQKLLPKKVPENKNIDLAAYSVPANRISGDYYDILLLKGNKIGLVICDVAGLGIPAALVMVMIRSILRLIACSDSEVATILTWVNRGIAGQIDIDHFATMSILSYDPGKRELIYSNAGNPPLLIYSYNIKQIEMLDTAGLPVGIEKTTRYGQKRIKLKQGDFIVLYNDGVIKAMNKQRQQYTFERFTTIIQQNVNKSAKELINIIISDLNQFTGKAKLIDNQTILIMKIK